MVVSGFELRAAVVCRPYKKRVVPHPFSLERIGDVAGGDADASDHALRRSSRCERNAAVCVAGWALIWSMHIVKRDIHEQWHARVVRVNMRDCLPSVQFARVSAVLTVSWTIVLPQIDEIVALVALLCPMVLAAAQKPEVVVEAPARRQIMDRSGAQVPERQGAQAGTHMLESPGREEHRHLSAPFPNSCGFVPLCL